MSLDERIKSMAMNSDKIMAERAEREKGKSPKKQKKGKSKNVIDTGMMEKQEVRCDIKVAQMSNQIRVDGNKRRGNRPEETGGTDSREKSAKQEQSLSSATKLDFEHQPSVTQRSSCNSWPGPLSHAF